MTTTEVPTIRYGARTTEDHEVAATKVGAWSTSFTAIYETDPGLIEQVLPPPLVATEPRVKVSIATVEIDRPEDGARVPVFGAGTFGVQCRHGDVDGYYPLLMPMTTEQSVIGGRETFGEPKKLAQIALQRDGDALVGTVTRMGVTIIELRGTVTGSEDPPAPFERTDFYLKFLRDPGGDGFDAPPSLVHCHRTETNRTRENVNGEILLRESPFDPVADLPVRRIVEMSLSERQSQQRGEIVATLDPEAVAPFVHQRYDDVHPAGGRPSNPGRKEQ
jgi:acetoacetate decarboxylase